MIKIDLFEKFLKSYLEMVTKSLEGEWSSLLGVGEEKYLWGSNILLNESLVVVLSNFDALISNESSSKLLQVLSIEAFF